MGTATGAITVVTGIFVMPGTPYLQALAFERDKMVQALGISFTTFHNNIRPRARAYR